MKPFAIGFCAFLLACVTLWLINLAGNSVVPFDAGSRGFYRVVNLALGELLKARSVSRDAPKRDTSDMYSPKPDGTLDPLPKIGAPKSERVARQPSATSEVELEDFPNGTLVFATGNTFNDQRTKWTEVIVGGAYAYKWTSLKYFFGWLPAKNLQRQKILTFPGTTLPRSAFCGRRRRLGWWFEWDDRRWEFEGWQSYISGTGKPAHSPALPNTLLFQGKQPGVSVTATLIFPSYEFDPSSPGEYNATALATKSDGSTFILDSLLCATHPKIIVPLD